MSLKTRLTYEKQPWVSTDPDAYEIPGLLEYTARTNILDSSTLRPIYDWCLAVEHVRIAQAYQACKAVYTINRMPCPLLNLVVDGFIFEKPRKSVTADKLKELLESITVECLPRLEAHVRGMLSQPDPKQKRLKTAELYPISGTASDARVFRVVVPEARQHLRGPHTLEKVSRDWPMQYKGPEWTPLEVDAAKEHVREGGSLCVTGLAGTGKSHIIREMVAELKSAGKKVVIIAKTHNAAMVAGGDTADHFIWRHVREGGSGADVIWVDEISMLDVALLQDLNHASFRDPPLQWILSGDFNQYAPFFDSFMGKSTVTPFKGSDLLHSLSGGKMLTMTHCMRSDAVLFDWYASLVEEPLGSRFEQPMSVTAQQARSEFTVARATGFIAGTTLAPTNLVISHRLRETVNEQCNIADAKGRDDVQPFTLAEFEYKAVAGTNNPQCALFWVGQRVVACSKGRKLRNGREYEILELCSFVIVKAADEEPIKLKRSEFFRCMRLRYAVTYASAQGLTLQGLLALHDVGHRYFDWRKLYVGLSRATGRDQVIVM